ncbi:MAG: ferritin-like domain-containing protein [Gemmatimonadota bacterium]|nr:ferritin-like domain-containing protein [Gemmatimonadota bacterium]
MTTQKTLFDSIDPEIIETITNRQEAISKGASASSKVMAALAIGSIPVALAALSKEAYGQTPADVVDVLQFALTLEYLESEFYNRGVANADVMAIPAGDRPIFTTIQLHENDHVAALKTFITARGAVPGTKPTFDFTAKGAVAGFNFGAGQYATFQVLAQAFEDTGVRAYKGQAGRLISDKGALNAALSIHSVEARHASEIRRLRGKKGWITGKSRDDLPAFTQGIYDGEDNTVQAGLDISALGTNNGGVDAVTQSFDEPLTKDAVLAIVSPFIN